VSVPVFGFDKNAYPMLLITSIPRKNIAKFLAIFWFLSCLSSASPMALMPIAGNGALKNYRKGLLPLGHAFPPLLRGEKS
jgi:hypothetical protein